MRVLALPAAARTMVSPKKAGVAALFTVAAIGAALWRGGWHPAAPAVIALLAGLGLASAIDLEHQRVPNQLIAWTTLLVTGLFGVATVSEGGGRFIGALMGGLALFLMFWVIHARSPEQFGAADVKLAFVVGVGVCWFGLGQLRWVLLWTAVGLAMALVATGGPRRARDRVIAFVPVLSAATAVTIVLASD